ncbi:MAG: ATP-dependent DNA helicase RecG [Rubrimonas sp.]|uniref:ATP-dependent DNA helicase RecG n=1 Tax=Rubrimonas sp. TaxID=2036015 RepID=UPI002FDE2ED2
MSARPEPLWPLFAELTALPGVGPASAKLFARLDATRPRDLLFLAPHNVIDRRLRSSIVGVPEGAVATVEVEIGAHHPPRAKGRPYRIDVRDAEAEFQLVYFHGAPEHLRRIAPSGARRIASGRIEIFDGLAQMPHPDHLLPPAEAEALPEFEPVYPATQGLGQRTIARAVEGALQRAPDPPEWIDPAVLAREAWPGWRAAVRAVHAPDGPEALAPDAPARARLAYDELFSHQLTLALARAKLRRGKGRVTQGDGRLRKAALTALPYAPTGAQRRALAEIEADMAAPQRMNRLLQGDVGSGKTLVALMAMLVAVEAGGQAAMMAPTELLARQHFDGVAPLAETVGVRVELLTGRDKGAARAEKLARAASGETSIFIGTHALFQKDVDFADLRLAVIDEQHRFGVRQRMELAAKGGAADMLVTTATPIPRTLALAGFGDMDVSVLDEKPPGRKPVETRLISMGRLEEVIARLGAALAQGRRVYWVCPLVEETGQSDLPAAEARFAALKARFGDAVRMAHGQMPHAERDAAMADFASGRAQILVATTVVEVGVNVPEASVMVIERAETFGLAQLHQLRGRVGRGSDASSCLLLYGPLGETARARLTALRDTEDGFRIAEEDLRLRGFGDLLGAQQSGLPRFRIADLERQGRLLKMAQDDARLALARDPDLTSDRGAAMRLLLWLHDRDAAIRYLAAG